MDEESNFVFGGHTYDLTSEGSHLNALAHIDLLCGEPEGLIQLLRSGHNIDARVKETLAKMLEQRNPLADYHLHFTQNSSIPNAADHSMKAARKDLFELYIGYIVVVLMERKNLNLQKAKNEAGQAFGIGDSKVKDCKKRYLRLPENIKLKFDRNFYRMAIDHEFIENWSD